jgi:hypothetical protein
MAVLQHCFVFEHGGSGHLLKWRHNFDFAFFELSMLFLVQYVYQISSQSGYKWPSHVMALILKMAAAVAFF